MTHPYRSTLARHGLYDGPARDTIDERLTCEGDVRRCILREWPDYVAEVVEFTSRKNASGHPVFVAHLRLTEAGELGGKQVLSDIRRYVGDRLPTTVECALEVVRDPE